MPDLTAASFQDYTATGSETEFTFNFPYLLEKHVLMSVTPSGSTTQSIYDVDDPEISSIGTSPSQVNLGTYSPSAGDKVRIFRCSLGKTKLKEQIVDFTDGSTINEVPLDQAYLHALYMSQEAIDGIFRLPASVHEQDPVRKAELRNISLGDLSNVTTAGLAEGDVIVYDSGTSEFVNLPIGLRYDSGTGNFGFGGTQASAHKWKFTGDILMEDGTNEAVLTLVHTGSGSSVLRLQAETPALIYKDTNAAADEGNINLGMENGYLHFATYTDAGVLKHIPLSIGTDGQITMSTLPTTDPSNTNEIWNSDGFVMLSGSEALINALGDVDTTGVSAGKFLKYSAINSKWEAQDISEISEIGDVNAPGASNKDLLEYDGSEWVNRSRYIYDSGWVTQWNTTTLAANAFDAVTMTTEVNGYFPFNIQIWGRSASSPNEVYPLNTTAISQSSVTGTVGVQAKYNESTRDLTLYFQDVAVWHEGTSGIGSSILWGGIDEIRVTIT